MIKALCVVGVLMTAGPGQSASFDAASVRLDSGPSPQSVVAVRGGPGSSDPSRVTYTRVPLSFLITLAYNVGFDRIKDPGWISDLSNTYTVAATMPAATTKEQFRLMLQNLLAERLGLEIHRASRPLPGFELVVAQGGPKLSEWTPEPIPDGPAPPIEADADEFPVLATGYTGCRGGGQLGVMMPMKVTCRASMEDFAQFLSQRYIKSANGAPAGELSPEVIDKTELHGIYEFKFVFEGAIFSGRLASSEPTGPATGRTAPALFDALQRQLGLRLVKVGSVPVSFLFVDSAQKIPTAN